MASSENRAILIGNLGADPEIRQTATGRAVANIRLATSYGRKNKDTGEWDDVTTWHNVVLWGRDAEVCHEKCRKGDKVYVSGPIENRQWTDRDGNTRYSTEVVAKVLVLMSRRRDDAAPPAQQAPPADFGDEDIPF